MEKKLNLKYKELSLYAYVDDEDGVDEEYGLEKTFEEDMTPEEAVFFYLQTFSSVVCKGKPDEKTVYEYPAAKIQKMADMVVKDKNKTLHIELGCIGMRLEVALTGGCFVVDAGERVPKYQIYKQIARAIRDLCKEMEEFIKLDGEE